MYLVTNGRLITRDTWGKGYYEHGAVAFEGSTCFRRAALCTMPTI